MTAGHGARHVVIVGGGVSGLAAAHALRIAAPAERLGITVLEADARLGGKVQTERVTTADGAYVVERGPDLFLTRKPELAALCRRLGVPLQPTRPAPRRSYVMRNGRLHELPEGLTGLVPARVRPLLTSPLLSLRGRLRVLAEPFVPPAKTSADVTVADFLSRRMGREAYEALVAPLLAGVYGDGRTLSAEATVPELLALVQQHGSLARAFWHRGRTGGAAQPDGPAFASVVGGLGSLVTALAAALDQVKVRTDAPVHAIGRNGHGFAVELAAETLRADAVLVALPATASAPLLGALDTPLAEALASIPHEGVALASLAYPRAAVDHPLDAHGYLVPPVEGGPVRAVTWVTSKFDGRAPDGQVLARVFFCDPTAPHLDDDILRAAAHDALAASMGVRGAPTFAHIVRWPRALPRYTLGHAARVAAAEARQRNIPGLFLAGPSLYGAGLPDSVRVAQTAAGALLTFLDLPR